MFPLKKCIFKPTMTKSLRMVAAKSEAANSETKLKRPPSAYLLFTAQERPNVQKAHPDMKANEMFKELGNLWKSASPETRAKFEKMAQKEKEQYEAQKANSNEKKVNVKGGKKEKKQKPGKKDKNLDIGSTPAQKPRSAYILFSIDARAVILKEKPNLKPTEVLAALGAAWKAASLDIREKYGVLAMVEKESYGKSKNQKQSNID